MHAVPKPTWRFEWNPNTLVVLLGFVGGFITWGATWERMSTGQTQNASSIERLDKRLTALEVGIRSLDTQELRLAAVEKQASEATVSMRSLEATLNVLGSDVKVVKEILLRLENGNNRQQQNR